MAPRSQAATGRSCRWAWHGVLAALPFAVWLFLAIEQLPLAAEESTDPKKDMPAGIMLGMLTLIVSAHAVLVINPSIAGVGSHALGTSGEPILDGFRAIYGDAAVFGLPIAKMLALAAVVGLVASFHTIIYAKGRQIYSLSRAGYFPTALSVTHASTRRPHVAMIAGSVLALAIMLLLFYGLGAESGGAAIGGTLLNMAVFGAMCSYVLQGVSFILLAHQPQAHRAALQEPVRRGRRGVDHRHRAGDDLLPAHRSGLSAERDVGGGLDRLGRGSTSRCSGATSSSSRPRKSSRCSNARKKAADLLAEC